jgi:YkoY family integral membrane protein
MDNSLLLDFGIVLQLVILEGLLSFDNALALAALVERRLKDPKDRKRALTWGIWGAYIFRTIVIFIGVWLMANPWIRVVAGVYLVWIAFDELYLKRNHADEKTLDAKSFGWAFLKLSPLWATVVSVELMDIMFSIDSVAVALAISNKKWVLILGALLGIVMMRLAAQFFIVLIAKFPILIKTAFVLVGIAGVNILLDSKDVPIPFTGGYKLTVGMAIPEHPFLVILFAIFVGSILLNWMLPKYFKRS